MKHYALYFILLAIILMSCNKEKRLALNAKDPNMNLKNLKVGQQFYYVLLEGEEYGKLSASTYEYTGDTLKVEVMEKNKNGYVLSEKITEGSAIRSSTDEYNWGEDEFKNIWRVRNDSLVIEGYNEDYVNSYFLGPRGLSLKEFTEEVKSPDWRALHYFSEGAELFVKDYSLLGSLYERLNVRIDNRATVFDGPSVTTAYSKEHGIVKVIIYATQTNLGHSWDRIK